MANGQIYVVLQGDCISSIAEREGFLPNTLWDANPKLKVKRKNPNALLPGDELLIPEKRLKTVSGATDQTHKFVLKLMPTKFRLVVERYQKPLANKKYILTVDSQIYNGTTSGSGLVEVVLPPNATSGLLQIPDESFECELEFGCLDPVDEISGAQGRLQNLGYYHGEITGEMNEDLQEALQFFQSDFGVPVTGELDDATNQKLLDRHDQTHSPPAASQAAAESGSPGSDAIANDESDVPSDEEDSRDIAALAVLDDDANGADDGDGDDGDDSG